MNSKRRPNVVFVLTDDQGYGDLGCHGNEVINTPAIDRHHADSVRFTDFHVGTTCAPTRAGLMSGHDCCSAGVWHTIGGRSLMRENEWTLANALSGAGYRTGIFGKWHLGDTPPYRPHERGFEESVCHHGGGISQAPDWWGNDYFDDTYYVNGVPRRFDGYCTDVFFREALDFIGRHKDEPFLCCITTNAPHGPLNVDPEYWKPYADKLPSEHRARFYGMIANIDDNFAGLQSKLDELGLTEDTILIFMTDNGTASGVDLGPDGFPNEYPGSFNAGMRGLKGSQYDGGHRVPFLMRYPGGGLSGVRDMDVLSSYTDFMPTILDLCGVEVPAGRSFHGRSLAPVLRGESDESWEQRVLVADTQRIARPMKWARSATMKKNWRLIDGKQLYDMKNDPGQTTDVAEKHPDMVTELRQGYEDWWDKVSVQFYRDVPTVLGLDDEKVALSIHDLRNDLCAFVCGQNQIRKGAVVAGYWEVDIRQAGTYDIDLHRWPEHTGHALDGKIPENEDVEFFAEGIEPGAESNYSGSIALALQWASLTIGGKTHYAEIEPGSRKVTFRVEIEEGEDHLHASFSDSRMQEIAPYFVYVTRR